MPPDIHEILKKHWGYDTFRPQQEAIIRHILAGGDALALLPTGGGKSICFQVPAMAMDGLCLVVSPLIALMKDQVSNLRKRGITAFAIVSGMEFQEVVKTLELAVHSNCKFLYVSPERLTTALFREYLPALPIRLIAVDEAHCISQWGYDFRPPYLQIAEIREMIPEAPILALTASATPEVQTDICEKLMFRKEAVFQTSFARPNLSYSVKETYSKLPELVHILNKVPGSGIVYCKSRKRTKDIALLLQQQSISVDFYHAGLSADERSTKQEEWIAGKTRIMVCTNAFGMGIDKPDVRIVVHYDVPDTLENYYQEAGRAGRDLQRAYAALLYNAKDISDLETQPDIRYPPESTITEVYRALVNYLQIPAGSGEGKYYDFDLAAFTERFSLSPQTTAHALQALAQDGWIQLNEKTGRPSKLGFICTRSYLREVQETKPEWNEVMLALLRNYEGIFDHQVTIREKKLAKLCELPLEELVQKLERLHTAGVVKYEPAPEMPQVFFLKNRVPVEHFRLNAARHFERKDTYRRRITEMIAFTTGKKTCRAVSIGVYFGDDTIAACGICDNCIAKKKEQPSAAITAEQYLMAELKKEPLLLQECLRKLEERYGARAAESAIRRLESELLIRFTPDGYVQLK